MTGDANEIQSLVNDLVRGDRQATQRLLPLVYDDLRAMASRLMTTERASHTLQPTALCNEACARLIGSGATWTGKEHLLAVAAIAMRQILVNQARSKNALKRGGGGPQRVTLADVPDQRSPSALIDVLSLETALNALESEDPTLARIVELRYFAGMSIKQVAVVMDQSERTINRLWRTAQAELAIKLRAEGDAP